VEVIRNHGIYHYLRNILLLCCTMFFFLDVDSAVWFLQRDCHCACSGVNVGCGTIFVQPRLHSVYICTCIFPCLIPFSWASSVTLSVVHITIIHWQLEESHPTTHCSSLAYKYNWLSHSWSGQNLSPCLKDGNTLYP
jgi:hypothetical protein